jgi:hypothetical protein
VSEQQRERGHLVSFLLFYLRSGFLLAVVGLPVVRTLRGIDEINPLVAAAIMGVLTLGFAVLSYRRRLKADAYVPPDFTPIATAVRQLPSSASTPPGALDRRRGLAVVWWSLMILSGAAIAWSAVAFVSETIPIDGPWTLAYSIATFVSVFVWLPAAVLFVWTRPVLARNPRLAADRPRALILTVFFGFTDVIAAGIVLRRVCELRQPWWRARVRTLSTLVVDASGIEVWRGGPRPRLQYRVPWDRVGSVLPAFVDVDTGSSDSLQLGINVGFRVREAGETGWLDLSFLATRSSLWASFPYRSRTVIEGVAAAIESQRPDTADLFRGLTVDELRQAFDEFTSAGDQAGLDEVLDALGTWRERRGGSLPAGSEWLAERLDKAAAPITATPLRD